MLSWFAERIRTKFPWSDEELQTLSPDEGIEELSSDERSRSAAEEEITARYDLPLVSVHYDSYIDTIETRLGFRQSGPDPAGALSSRGVDGATLRTRFAISLRPIGSVVR